MASEVLSLATCVDGALYYPLTDPTGTSLLLTDASGAEAGRLLYDAYGGVLSSTLSTTLRAALAGAGAGLDPETGLVYQGQGRYYDPAQGRPLQPNPVGGPPLVPQGLNRYAASVGGQPGVAEAVANSEASFLSTVLPFGAGASATASNEAFAVQLFQKLHLFEPLFQPTAARARIGLQPFEEAVIHGQAFGELLASLEDVRIHASRSGITYLFPLIRTTPEVRYLSSAADRLAGRLAAFGEVAFLDYHAQTSAATPAYRRVAISLQVAKRLKAGSGFLLDVVINAGFQYLADARNPYLTPGQKTGRAFVSGAGGALSALGVSAALGCSVSIICVVGASIVGGVVWAYAGQPLIFDVIFPEFFQPQKKLKPLNTS